MENNEKNILKDPFEAKKKYVNLFAAFMVLTALFYAFLFYFYFDLTELAIYCSLGAIAGTLTVCFGFRYLPYHYVGIIFLLIYTSTLLSIAWMVGGATSPAYWWLTSVPLVTAFILDETYAIYCSCLIFVVMSAMSIVGQEYWANYNLISEDISYIYSTVSGICLLIVISVFAILIDKTRIQRENEKAELQKNAFNSTKLSSLGEMAGGIAHEINNPLTVINGNTSILRKKLLKLDTTENELKHLDKIEETVYRIKSIVESLKNISREGDAGNVGQVKIKNIIDDVLNVCRERIYFKEIKLKVLDEFEIQSLSVVANRVESSQVLLNLINNSIDALENFENKVITLSLEKSEENTVFLKLSDTGEGIELELREKIFQPFFTTKVVGKGTGLGLSLSASLMEKSGGQLYLEDSEETTFVLVFKLQEPSTNVA